MNLELVPVEAHVRENNSHIKKRGYQINLVAALLILYKRTQYWLFQDVMYDDEDFEQL